MENLRIFEGYNSNKNSFFVPGYKKRIRRIEQVRKTNLSPTSEIFRKIIVNSKESLDNKRRICITPENLSYHLKVNSPVVTPKIKKSQFNVGVQVKGFSRLSERRISKFIDTKYSSESFYFPKIYITDSQKNSVYLA